MNDVRPPVWIFVLVFILTIWNPASLALRAASAVSSLSSASTLALALLAVRIVVTSIGVAAGIALWLQRPGAVWLAKLALVLVAIETAVRMTTRTGLSAAPPGTRLPLALGVILHNSAWYLYLQLSRRVRAAYGLESLADQGEPHA
jgi:hypothetical protein